MNGDTNRARKAIIARIDAQAGSLSKFLSFSFQLIRLRPILYRPVQIVRMIRPIWPAALYHAITTPLRRPLEGFLFCDVVVMRI